MTTNNNNDNDENNKNSDNNWLGFSLSHHSSDSAHTFNYQNIYYGGVEGVSNSGIYSSYPIMPLKSDGSLCLMENITKSQGMMVGSTTPKLENFFGGVTMGTPELDSNAMYYHQNYQIQPQHHYQDYSGLYSTVQQHGAKIAEHATSALYLPSIGEGSEKVDQQKKIVHRKSLDTFGQRTSQYRGVTRHRWTGRYEAHLWDNSCKKEGQTRKGRQVYLGGYDMEEKAARAYDLAALKYWGASTHINFPVESYQQELEEMKNMSRQEYVAHLRRRSSGFSRGASIYRGVTRHHQHGRWQARIGRVAGNKDLYLGTFSTQEDAAEAYDVAAIKFRGMNAVTNFDMSKYNVEAINASDTLLSGELAKRAKVQEPTEHLQICDTKTISSGPNGGMLEWKMELYDQNITSGSVEDNESSTIKNHLSNSSSSQEDSPKRNNDLLMVLGIPSGPGSNSSNTWIPTAAETATTTQLRTHMPMFAAWSDA
uniref:AP2-like ethylene-responsive transcription factor ANT n=1 Tax=Tanacetum cinerariifolium TaxID=118510 RepID=A0A6L2JI06_TANCI|nr:AP2-like ethylene-responsive transcription factor ANT [Tanacetum cinerariifolium]